MTFERFVRRALRQRLREHRPPGLEIELEPGKDDTSAVFVVRPAGRRSLSDTIDAPRTEINVRLEDAGLPTQELSATVVRRASNGEPLQLQERRVALALTPQEAQRLAREIISDLGALPPEDHAR